MDISKETLRAMISQFNLIELSEEELELVKPDVEAHLAAIAKARTLDLSRVPSARQIRAKEVR